jgi:uncharacterized protein YegP (UPF0339 family)
MGTFVVYIDNAGEFRRYLMAENHNIADSAEGYRSRQDCENGIRLVKRMAPKAKLEAPPKKVEVLV